MSCFLPCVHGFVLCHHLALAVSSLSHHHWALSPFTLRFLHTAYYYSMCGLSCFTKPDYSSSSSHSQSSASAMSRHLIDQQARERDKLNDKSAYQSGKWVGPGSTAISVPFGLITAFTLASTCQRHIMKLRQAQTAHSQTQKRSGTWDVTTSTC